VSQEARDGGAELSGTAGRIRYRATWQQALPLTVSLGAVVLMQLSDLSPWADQGQGVPVLPFGSRALALALPCFILLELWALNRYVGLTLTPEAAVVHNLRRRTIRWTDVSDVAVEPFAGGRRVVFYETNGQRTPLRMPTTGFLSRDRGFDDKVATIRGWWRANGGVAYARDAAAEPVAWGFVRGRVPERLRIRPAAVRSVPTALLIGWLAIDAVMAGFAEDPGAGHPTLLGRVLATLAALLLLLGAGFLSFGRSVLLTADQLTVRGLRPRTVPWGEVRAITVEPRRGGRRIVVTEADGRRTPLPAPRVGLLLWDSEFEAKLGTLRSWWHTRTEAGTPPADAAVQASDRPPLLPYRGPRLWQKALLALVCAVLGFEILLFVLVGVLFLTAGL
jgi:hypothetical protein